MKQDFIAKRFNPPKADFTNPLGFISLRRVREDEAPNRDISSKSKNTVPEMGMAEWQKEKSEEVRVKSAKPDFH